MKKIFIVKQTSGDGRSIKIFINRILEEANNMNSHHHRSKNVILVDNGIIENYNELKNQLIEKGYSFISDTDTEVISATLDDIKKNETDNIKAINKLIETLEGAYTLSIIFDGDCDTLYVVRKDNFIDWSLDSKIFSLNDMEFEITDKKIPMYTTNDKVKQLCKKKGLYK